MENDQNQPSPKIMLGLSLTLRVLLAIAVLGLALAFLRVSADMLNALILSWIIVLVASPLLHHQPLLA